MEEIEDFDVGGEGGEGAIGERTGEFVADNYTSLLGIGACLGNETEWSVDGIASVSTSSHNVHLKWSATS